MLLGLYKYNSDVSKLNETSAFSNNNSSDALCIVNSVTPYC